MLQRGRRRLRHRALRRGARPSSRPTPRPSPTRAGRSTRCSATPRPRSPRSSRRPRPTADYPDVHAFLAVLFFRSGLVPAGEQRARPARRPRPAARPPRPDRGAARAGRRGPGRRQHRHHRGLTRSGGRGDVAALGELVALPGEDPGRRLLPAQLVLELRAVGERGARAGRGSRRRGCTAPRPVPRTSAATASAPAAPAPSARRSSASTDSPSALPSGSSVCTQRTNGLATRRVMSRSASSAQIPSAWRHPRSLSSRCLVRLRPVAPVPSVGVAHDVELAHGR